MISGGIELIDVSKRYSAEQDSGVCALTGINLSIAAGEFVGIVGMNGSGKTTLARLLNGLILPTNGRVLVNNMDTRHRRCRREIRRLVGMVFQNPDNQLVSPVVEEEIAFGPENLNLPPQEVSRRVEEVLKITGLGEIRYHAPHLLSGGQKQRVAVASALAMQPDYLVLDEPTSMLDQSCRRELINHLHLLNQKYGITIILISHCMEDLAGADRLIVLHEGCIVGDGAPWEIFARESPLADIDIKPPDIVRLLQILQQMGFSLDAKVTTLEQMVNVLWQ